MNEDSDLELPPKTTTIVHVVFVKFDEQNNLVEETPRFLIHDPNLFEAFQTFLRKFAQKYPLGAREITKEDLEEILDQTKEDQISKVLDLVDFKKD